MAGGIHPPGDRQKTAVGCPFLSFLTFGFILAASNHRWKNISAQGSTLGGSIIPISTPKGRLF
jgi:hypothetical protein